MDQQYFQGSVAAIGKAQVDIARLETQVAHLTETVDELKKSNAKINEKLDEIQVLLSEARGGWRILMLIGGAGATVGGLVAWAMQHITIR